MSNETKFNQGGVIPAGSSVITNRQILCEYLLRSKKQPEIDDDDEPTAPNV